MVSSIIKTKAKIMKFKPSKLNFLRSQQIHFTKKEIDLEEKLDNQLYIRSCFFVLSNKSKENYQQSKAY